MASDYIPSFFLLFPNEIIRSVFDYLSPQDLLKSFGYLSNKRIQSLITEHLCPMKLDLIDTTSLDWLRQHLSVVRQYVKHISIDIKLVGELIQIIPMIDALTIVYDDDTQHLIDYFVIVCQKVESVHIGALTLTTYDGTIGSTTVELLLGGNGQMPEHTLNIDSCLRQIDIQRLPSSQLRHVDLIVKEEKVLHVLCAHMPNLETIKVAFISNGLQIENDWLENATLIEIIRERPDENENDANEHIFHSIYKSEDETDDITIVASAHLRSVVIKGHIATFNRLTRLFELASASLTTIRMSVWAYSIINPEQINDIAPHIDFQFDVYYNMIEMPSDFNWQKYLNKFTRRPALRCENTMFCNFSSLVNRSVFWLRTTRMFLTSPQSLYFSQVHTLKFQYCQITMSTETVKFIQQTFPRIRTLVWRLSQPKVSTKIPLSMVNTLVVYSEDRKTLGALLILCPNVYQVRFTKNFEGAEQLPELKDGRIQETCKQITSVQLVPNDNVTEKQIKELFPNANITYDATPFYERMF